MLGLVCSGMDNLTSERGHAGPGKRPVHVHHARVAHVQCKDLNAASACVTRCIAACCATSHDLVAAAVAAAARTCAQALLPLRTWYGSHRRCTVKPEGERGDAQALALPPPCCVLALSNVRL